MTGIENITGIFAVRAWGVHAGEGKQKLLTGTHYSILPVQHSRTTGNDVSSTDTPITTSHTTMVDNKSCVSLNTSLQLHAARRF